MKTKMIIVLVLSALVVCSVPVKAQGWQEQQEQQGWTSSSMLGSGSAYSSTVTPVGSYDAPQMATTSSNSPMGMRGRQNSGDFGDGGNVEDDNQDIGSPVGDPWILLLFAIAAAIFVKRKAAKAKSEEVNN
jgi:hypothetical protein